MRRYLVRGIVVVGVVCLFGTGLAACGGGASKAEIAEAEKHGRQEKAEKEKERKLEREIQKLKDERREEKKRKKEKQTQPDHGAAPEPSAPPAPSTPSGTDCGEGVVAGPETSCGFALETRNEYETYIGSGPGTVEAYSDANETWYSMTCTAAPHACSGAISATVYFP
jgi:hypothetical protein